MLMQDYLAHWAQRTPDAVAIEDGTASLTFAELDARSDAFASALDRRGLVKGDRVAAVAKNCVEWAVLYFGTFKTGVVLVPLNFRLHPREWAYQLADSGARAVFAQEAFAAGVDEVAPHLLRVVWDGTHEGWEPLQEWLVPGTPPALDLSPSDELYQMYTSGTTGRPKGAVLTHSSADGNVTQARTSMPLFEGESVLLVMPLFHAGAAVGMLCYVACGATLHVMADFVPAEVVRVLDEEGITQTTFVPAMVQALLLTVPDVRSRAYKDLRYVGYGAAPISESVLRTAMDVFGCEFLQVYGQTESSAGLTLLSVADHHRALSGRPELLQSCGRPILGTRLRIEGPDGAELPVGEVGEVVCRGPQVMKGYWRRPEQTAETLRDGWLHTGDLGRVDAEGYLYVVDRAKDLIVTGGENVYSKEVEDVLYALPGVAEAAVIGVPDDRWGETVKALVVPAEGASLTPEQVQAHCRSHLAGFKCPTSVELVGPFPRTVSGKVQKNLLREPYWAGHERRVG